jgi:hypothetical protein
MRAVFSCERLNVKASSAITRSRRAASAIPSMITQ